MKKSLTSNPAVYFVSFVVASVIGITYIVSGTGIFFEKINIYLTGVHTVGYYERQVLPPGGRYGSSINEYSFQTTENGVKLKYFVNSHLNDPQIEVIYNQNNSMESMANTPNDWLNYFGFLSLPLALLVLMVSTAVLFFRNKKKLNKEGQAPLV